AAAHLFGDDADLLDARALGRVDHRDDVAVAELAVTGDEHRLFLAGFEDVAEPRLEILHGHRLVVDGDLPGVRVLEHDLRVVLRLGRRFRLQRQVDVDAALCQWQRRPEDDQQAEQHVDEGRGVHIRTGGARFSPDGLFGAELLVCVGHDYLPPAGAFGSFFGSVMRPMSSIPTARRLSIASMIALYLASLSPLIRTTFSVLSSSAAFTRVGKSLFVAWRPFTQNWL